MGNQSANIAFLPPANTGGDPIIDYIVMAFINGAPTGIFVSTPSSPVTILGLTNGVTYTFEVYAVNAVGAGPYSAPSNPFTPMASLPGAPLNVAAVASNAQATITFTQPTTDGGAPITRYTATSTPGGFTGSSTTVAPIVITGLTDGVQYFFTVTATNSTGTGPPSVASNIVTPSGVPGAPLNPVAAAGDASAIISFSPPLSSGGLTITGYTVTSSPGALTGTGSTSPITVTGLTNTDTYTFTVTATNSAGTGPASVPSNAVTPQSAATVPTAPLNPTAAPGNAQATVAFSAPLSNGGSAITLYTVTAYIGGVSTGITATGGSSPITITGLTNNQAYTFEVTATNGVGTGPSSVPTNSVTPTTGATVPSAPLSPSAVAGNAQATVTFSPPLSNGGDTITLYTVTAYVNGVSTGITATGASSPIVVTGLTNGTSYTFEVTATNAIGTGPSSVATSPPVTPVAPATVPTAPLSPSAIAGNASAIVSFLPPASDGGATISQYTVTSSPGGITASGGASPITITGLTNNQAYTFTVYATNSVGNGPNSVATNSVTPQAPATVPSAPLSPAATAGNASAVVTFSAPLSNGGATITGYTATAYIGGVTTGITGTLSGATPGPITVSGLTNGSTYTFEVTATNSVGTGPASVPSNAVVPAQPATVPGAPTAVTAIAGNAQASVSFTAPSNTGGDPITRYTVTSTPGNIIATGTASPILVPGLTNGTSYTFTVYATNAVGNGPNSVPSAAVTPSAVPGPPINVVATFYSGYATVTFDPPTSNGGSPITRYNATSVPAGGTGSLTITTGGLYDGVATVNSAGVLVNGAGAALFGKGVNVSGMEQACADGYAPWYGNTPQWSTIFNLFPNLLFVRIPLNEASWLGLTCNQLNASGTGWGATGINAAGPSGVAAYRQAVFTAVGECQSRGAYVLLDDHFNAPDFTFGSVTAHTLPDGFGNITASHQNGQPPFMNSSTSGLFHASLASFFGTQATPQVVTLASGASFTLQNAAVLLELFNEPYQDVQSGWNATTWAAMKSGGTFSSWLIGGGPATVAQSWTTYGYQQALNVYRTAGATNVLLTNGGGYADNSTNFTSWMPVDTLSPPQVAVGQHPYQSGGLSNTTDTYPQNNSGWTTATGASAVLAAKIPLLFTEDGGYYGPSLGATEVHVTYMWNWCKTNGVAAYITWAALSGAAGAPTGSSGENYVCYATSPLTLTGGQGQVFAALT